MDLIEEVLALSLMIQSDSVALLHEGLSDRYEELAKEAYDAKAQYFEIKLSNLLLYFSLVAQKSALNEH
jgi:hypothetical protein